MDNTTPPPLALYEILEAELAETYTKLNELDSAQGYFKSKEEAEARHAPLDTWEKKQLVNSEVLPELYKLILRLPEPRSALCLSGGGIRSATFNLGVLQGLARHGLLGKFDYLSTVSGGGFVGGWLTAWIHRRGMDNVLQEMGDPPFATQRSVLAPDPRPVYELRTYSNYLTPKKGLLNADTWTLVAIYLRNLLLNWVVFLPVIMAVLILPRIYLAVMMATPEEWWVRLALILGFGTGTFGLTFAGLNLPSSGKRNDGLGRIWRLSLGPLVLSTVLLTTFWVWYIKLKSQGQRAPAEGFFGYLSGLQSGWWRFILFTAASYVIAFVFYIYFRNHRMFFSRREGQDGKDGGSPEVYKFWYWFSLLGIAMLLVACAGIVNGFLTWYAATQVAYFRDPVSYSRFYACFAVPLLLTLYNNGGMLIAGLTSRYTDDSDQEWWARAGAWIIIVILSWVGVNLLVLYGPSFLVTLQLEVGALINYLSAPPTPEGATPPSPPSIYSIPKLLIPIVTGAISLFGGFSAKTPANEREGKKAGPGAKLMQVIVNLSSLVFLLSILIFLALIVNWILTSVAGQSLSNWMTGSNAAPGNPLDHKGILYSSSGWFLLLLAAFIATLGLLLGRTINTNRFSLHYYWRNRIMRAYLGASNYLRRPNRFTGFDQGDNLQMHKLKPSHAPYAPAPGQTYHTDKSKLLHVVNIALNLVGGDKLAWQDRKAESFTVSPLHCGSYWLGYRRSEEYGGKDGISLGTAVAISGAAASPNMGYMMTSPVIRFLMTLFNVRLGWWLGNPGKAGYGDRGFDRFMNALGAPFGLRYGRTYDRDSPRHSIKPITQEAFGLTNDKSKYVYLSDGGHFENLGLYEMALRRCRLILVSDASTDPEYSFESLAQAVRQIRVDLGVPIDFKKFYIYGPGQNKNGAYCAIGTIKYSCIDKGAGDAENGTLIYLKPSLTGNEPRDILNYAGEGTGFPQESIVDQWFSEAQFESYRALGSHIVDNICSVGGVTHDRNTFNDLSAFATNLESSLSKTSWRDVEGELLTSLRKPGAPGEELGHMVQGVLRFLKGLKDKQEDKEPPGQ